MTPLETFCRQVRSRSEENRKAFLLVFSADLLSQCMSILRQEIDSMVRTIFLLSITDTTYRQKLIEDSVNGEIWRNKDGKGRVTDKEMVELADKLNGWTESVYRFGCAFIHLSSFHDYRERDPMDAISTNEKQAILKHMRYYHGGPESDDPKLADLVFYFPSVFHKIADNLEHYVKQLEEGKTLDKHEIRTS
jgi:hypothetical protein